MSLPRDGVRPVPVETARMAHAAFPGGNVYVRLRDELGTLSERHAMLHVAQARQQTSAFHEVYRTRSGIEGTFDCLPSQNARQAVVLTLGCHYVQRLWPALPFRRALMNRSPRWQRVIVKQKVATRRYMWQTPAAAPPHGPSGRAAPG